MDIWLMKSVNVVFAAVELMPGLLQTVHCSTCVYISVIVQ